MTSARTTTADGEGFVYLDTYADDANEEREETIYHRLVRFFKLVERRIMVVVVGRGELRNESCLVKTHWSEARWSSRAAGDSKDERERRMERFVEQPN